MNIRALRGGLPYRPGRVPEGWYVESGYRRTGVGRALLAAAQRWARDRGYTELASDALHDNELSRQAHLSCGFEEISLIRCFRKRLHDDA